MLKEQEILQKDLELEEKEKELAEHRSRVAELEALLAAHAEMKPVEYKRRANYIEVPKARFEALERAEHVLLIGEVFYSFRDIILALCDASGVPLKDRGTIPEYGQLRSKFGLSEDDFSALQDFYSNDRRPVAHPDYYLWDRPVQKTIEGTRIAVPFEKLRKALKKLLEQRLWQQGKTPVNVKEAIAKILNSNFL